MGKNTTVIKDLKRFKEKLTRDYSIQKMIFFGSRVSGKPHKYSDIDLVIISPKFRKMNFFKRGAKMYDYWTLRHPVDFLCYTPEEFKKLSKQITIVSEALRTGIEI